MQSILDHFKMNPASKFTTIDVAPLCLIQVKRYAKQEDDTIDGITIQRILEDNHSVCTEETSGGNDFSRAEHPRPKRLK